jgi:hypothetical protein
MCRKGVARISHIDYLVYRVSHEMASEIVRESQTSILATRNNNFWQSRRADSVYRAVSSGTS